MIWWIIAAVVYILALVFGWAMIKVASDTDRWRDEMWQRVLRERDE